MILLAAVLQHPGFGIYSWARLILLHGTSSGSPPGGGGMKVEVEKTSFEVDEA
jgi:hypothetical protein